LILQRISSAFDDAPVAMDADGPSTVPSFLGGTAARRASDARRDARRRHGGDERTPRGWSDASHAPGNRCAAIDKAVFERLARRAVEAERARRPMELPDEALETLAWLHGAKHLQKALEVVQNGRVRRLVGEKSGRIVYTVGGSGANEAPYLCFPSHFCSCKAFSFECVNREESLACKHQLAAKLASVLGSHRTDVVDDLLLGNKMLELLG
jgi:predicted nucleic acid-binding Zn finger protein